jgi:hypothetical protein
MYDIIQWLNANQGFALALLTFVYVAATIFVALLMSKSNTLARKSIEVAIQLDKSRSRPYVLFDILIDGSLVYAIVKNIGLTAAKNVLVSIEPALLVTANKEQKQTALINHVIEFIPPQREFKDFLDVSHHFVSSYPDLSFRGRIEYKDMQEQSYNEQFTINLNFQKQLSYIEEKDIAQEIEKIGRHVESVSRTMQRWKIGT